MGWPIQDNFNRADSDILGTMSDGHSWTEPAGGDIDIVSNQAKAGPGDGNNLAVVTETHTETDYYVQADIISASAADPGVVGRYSDTNNFYVLRLDSATLQLYKRLPAGWTLLGSYTSTVGAHSIKLEINGSSLKGYLDGVLRIDVTDTSHTSGKPGIRSYYGTNPIWDNFIADLLTVAGPTYPQLERGRRGIGRGVLIGLP